MDKRESKNACLIRQIFIDAIYESGLSAREIAKRAGIHRSTVHSALSGRRITTIDTWDLILAAAGVELGYRINKEN